MLFYLSNTTKKRSDTGFSSASVFVWFKDQIFLNYQKKSIQSRRVTFVATIRRQYKDSWTTQKTEDNYHEEWAI